MLEKIIDASIKNRLLVIIVALFCNNYRNIFGG